MQKFRLSIRTLLVIVLVVGLSFAALRSSAEWTVSAVFTLTLGILLSSLVFAVVKRGSEQLFWIGFAAFGWGYYFHAIRRGTLAVPELWFILLIDHILGNYLIPAGYTKLQTQVVISHYTSYAHDSTGTARFLQIAHSIISLLCGLVGTAVIQVFLAIRGHGARPEEK